MAWPCKCKAYALATFVALPGAICWTGCHANMPTSSSKSPRRDINAVLADHDRQLLAIPGVVGVYVGLMNDQETPCLKVMLARDDPHLRRDIPQVIEGYPVILEVTGEIKPLR